MKKFMIILCVVILGASALYFGTGYNKYVATSYVVKSESEKIAQSMVMLCNDNSFSEGYMDFDIGKIATELAVNGDTSKYTYYIVTSKPKSQPRGAYTMDNIYVFKNEALQSSSEGLTILNNYFSEASFTFKSEYMGVEKIIDTTTRLGTITVPFVLVITETKDKIDVYGQEKQSIIRSAMYTVEPNSYE